MKHYDLVVLGEEIAGSWLIQKFCETPSLSSKKILWIRTNTSLPTYRLPLSLARHFGISTEKNWSVELAFPTRVFNWDQEKLDFYLAGHSLKGEDWIRHDKKITRVCEHLFEHFPDLHVIAKGLWAYLGYSHSATAEATIWASFLAGEMTEWQVPLPENFPSLEIITLSPTSKLHFLKYTRQELEFEIDGEQKCKAAKVLLNMEVSKLMNCLTEGGIADVGLSSDVFSDFALYHLHVDFERGTYLPFQKSCLLFSTESVPDSEREISLIEKGNSVTIRVCERRNASLFSILERFKYALKDLARGYPDLPMHVKSYYPPLGLESCYSDAFREEVLNTLNVEKRDLYRLTQVSSLTAMACIKNISPQVHCHLPYPYGPLEEAKKILLEYV